MPLIKSPINPFTGKNVPPDDITDLLMGLVNPVAMISPWKRLYRGEPTKTYGIQELIKLWKEGDTIGRWFTPHKEIADAFVPKTFQGDPLGVIRYIDIPEHTMQGLEDIAVLLPPEVASYLIPLMKVAE